MGVLSSAPITLRAIDEVNSGPTHTYVNLVTHLSMGRVLTLLGSGSAYADAADQAERELRTALGIGPAGFDPGARGGDMNVYGGDNDANAYLFAVSAVLAQAAYADANKGVPVDATLQEMVNHIAADLSGNDPIGKQDAAALRDAEATLDPEGVMAALGERLASLGSSEVVPDINRVIDSDLDGLANGDDPDRDGDGHDGQAWGGDDCDDIDPTTLANFTYFADADGDGYGDPGAPVNGCVLPKGYVTDSSDCDDTRADVRDLTWYRDADEDGYGDPNNTFTACDQPDGYVADNTDCNDVYSFVNPGAVEDCNSLDDNCDGLTDGADSINQRTAYLDVDGDDYGDGNAGLTLCEYWPSGYVWDHSDCDDANPAIHPGVTEICDGVDNDCDGRADSDSDGDGWDVCDECDDGHATDHPGATEICDGVDNDCDGTLDNDSDGDGWAACEDCDNTNPLLNPGIPEICGNRVDDDCDGATGCGGLEAEVTTTEFTAIIRGESVGDEAGISVSGVGDVNGDGYEDLLVGAPGYTVPAVDRGATYLVLGPVSGEVDLTARQARWTGINGGDLSGCVVDGGADLDGDGNADFVIGAYQENTVAIRSGAAYISYGPATGDASLADADAVIFGEQELDQIGQALTLVGDSDGDEFADLLLGSRGAGSTSDVGPGAAYLFRGPISGSHSAVEADAVMTDASAGSSDEVGSSVTDLGDVDGDGLSDILVGAKGALRAMLILGPVQSTTAIYTDNDAIIHGPKYLFPLSAAGPGDVDGDGADDIWLNTYQTGTAYLLSGTTRGTVSATTDYMAEITSVGQTVGSAGDVDGDGFADLLVQGGLGVRLFYGPVTGSHSSEDANSDIEGCNSAMDHADLNGDGFSDLLLGGSDPNGSVIILAGGPGL